jgi:hypothetical protein
MQSLTRVKVLESMYITGKPGGFYARRQGSLRECRTTFTVIFAMNGRTAGLKIALAQV